MDLGDVGEFDETLDLIGELQDTLGAINSQIAAIGREAARRGVDASEVWTPRGEFLITPLLVAKANVLLALTNLK